MEPWAGPSLLSCTSDGAGRRLPARRSGLTVTDEGLLPIELEKIHGELLMAMEKIAIMKRGEKTRAGAEELHDTDRETIQANRAIKKLWKVLEDITARLNSLDKGR